MSGGRGALLAVASGLLLALSFPTPGLWPLALVAYAPLLLALDGAPPARAALLGWVTHATFSLIAFRFVWPALRQHGGLGLPTAACALGLLAALQGLRGACLGLLAAVGRRALPLPSAFVLAHLAAEHWPVVLSWSLSGAVHDQRPLIQAAALGGAPLVAALVASCSAPAAALVAWRAGRPWPWRWALAPALGLGLAAAAGSARGAWLDQEEQSADWLVGVVHGAVALGDPAEPPVEGWGDLRRAHRDLEARGARLVLWPETAAPFPVRMGFLDNDLLAQLGDPPATAAVVGALAEGPGGSTNSALLLSGGRVVGVYSKQRLLPFGEYVPLERWMPWLRAFSPRTARLRAPDDDPALALPEGALGLTICYEGVSPERTREAARGARLLLNLSNDAWFAGTSEPELHLAQTRLRAVELGRYLVRATNQGVSAVVAPSGRLLAEARGAPTRPLLARVRWVDGRTPFARWGEALAWAWWLALAAAIGPRREAPPRPSNAGLDPSTPGPHCERGAPSGADAREPPETPP